MATRYPPNSPYGNYAYGGPQPGQSLSSIPGSTNADPLLHNGSSSHLPFKESYTPDMGGGGSRWTDVPHSKKKSIAARPKFWVLVAVIVLVVAAIIVVPLYFFVIKPRSSSSAAAAGTNGTTAVRAVVTGGDGSTVTKADGTTFTYNNSFGGYCA